MRNSGKTTRRGFTLIELIVVVGIIALTASLTLPSMASIFTAGSDAQAYNAMVAAMSAARGVAIQNGTFAGVHVQMGDSNHEDTCYLAVVVYNPTTKNFSLADGYEPRPIPGNWAFGEVSSTYVTSSSPPTYQGLDDADPTGFTTLTVVFSPSGQLVRYVDGSNIAFDTTSASSLFIDGGNSTIWDDAAVTTTETGVSAVTMFEWPKIKAMSSAADRITELGKSGQFLAVNVNTGQLVIRR